MPDPAPVLSGDIVSAQPGPPAVVSGPPLSDLIDGWLIEYASPNTRAAYRRDLGAWLSYCTNSGLEPVAMPTRTHVAAWLRLRQQLQESGSTQARRLAAVSSWYRWLLSTGRRPPEAGNPARELEPRTKPKMIALTSAPALTREEVEALLAAADADTGGARLRGPAIVALLLYPGLRVSELIEANEDQLGHDRGHKRLRGSRKARTAWNRAVQNRPRAFAHWVWVAHASTVW